MKSIRKLRCRAARLAALGAASAAALAVTAGPAAAAPIPAGGMAVEHASLDWTGSTVMQSPFFGMYHYFSAGISEGTEATYKGAEGNAEVLLEAEAGAVASWVTHTDFSAEAGHHQVVRLSDGSGRIEADGSAKVSWDADFSVNFYGGLAPFSIEDPTLTVNPDGSGELTATLSGCAASQAEPQAGCVPFAPVPGAQIATFTGVQVDPEAPLTITPSYAGVEVETTKPVQNRTKEGWGAWPQAMVTFQNQTGLSSYFYSSGSSEDPKKAPLPFVVDFKGPTPTPPATSPSDGGSEQKSEGGTTTTAPTTPSAPGTVKSPKGVQAVAGNGIVKVATLACPAGGTSCTTVVPKRLGAKIGGKRYLLQVMAPKTIAAGKSATVRAHLPKAAREALAGRKVGLKVSVGLKANGTSAKQVVKVTIAGSN